MNPAPARLRFALMAALLLSAVLPVFSAPPRLVPLPARYEEKTGTLQAARLRPALTGPATTRVQNALTRLDAHWQISTSGPAAGTEANIRIQFSTTLPPLPSLGEAESYQLKIDETGVTLSAETDLGILRGLATLTQLNETQGAVRLPFVTIDDQPRFPWRGVLVDVGRHFQPPAVLRRTLDAMALAKLNVLHLHLTEDQGFRIESLTHPKLHEQGSDGRYFTQAEIRELIAYAGERGIRVVPEFDLPGHATAWLVSHPELASLPGPYRIERRWGIFDPVFDPTSEGTYALLSDVLGEMCALFPDPYFHIGGDENNGVQWSANPRLQRFIQENGLKDNHGLQAYFNRRMAALLEKHGKRMMGWDEILHPDLPRSILIQSWRGPQGLAQAARAGCQVLLSNGYYIDLSFPAETHYLNDPLPVGHGLSPEETARVLGGEATMWSEWVDEQTIDTRLWPRTAAIAERLWSPAEVRDVPDLYRRLDHFSDWLTQVGSRHEVAFLERSHHLVQTGSSEATLLSVRQLLRLIEPQREYRRGHYQPEFNQLMPLESLADYCRPDGDRARRADAVLRQVVDAEQFAHAEAVLEARRFWAEVRTDAQNYLSTATPNVRAARELKALATKLARAAQVVDEALTFLERKDRPTSVWTDQAAGILHDLGILNNSGTYLRYHEALRRVVAAAEASPSLRELSPEARRAALLALTPPLTASH